MSQKQELLRAITRAFNGNESYSIDEWFTGDFFEPTKPDWPHGHESASNLLALFRTLTSPLRFVALDMVEEADRVAVRWQLSATQKGEPLRMPSKAVYQFEEGRIAEGWGIPARDE